MSISLADLRARIETDLDDPTLQRIIDAAVKSIVRSAGNATEEVETKLAAGADWFTVSRLITTVTSIVERRRHSSSAVTLSSDDYRQVGSYRFLRLRDGANPALGWGAEVVITYVPEVDSDVRDRVTLDLCQVDLEFKAYESEKSGDWSGSQKDYVARRRELLSQIREGASPIV